MVAKPVPWTRTFVPSVPLVGAVVSFGPGRIVTWPSLRELLERFWSVDKIAVAETV